MDETTKAEILEKAKNYFRKNLAEAHKKNTIKLKSVKEFTPNPFLWSYLAYFLQGKNDAETIAKVLIYPRVLGTSINTSFGMGIQHLVTTMFAGISGSTTPGIDIEYIDKIDGRKKYCQLKAGPNVINRDDVATIKGHFRAAINLARQNHLPVQNDDYVFGLIYGEPSQQNSFIQEVQQDYPVLIGKDFWHHFTGDPNFYSDLVNAIGEVAVETNMQDTINEVIQDLAKDIEKNYPELINS